MKKTSDILIEPYSFEKLLRYFLIFIVVGITSAISVSHFLSGFISTPNIESMIYAFSAFAVFAVILLFQALFLRRMHFFLWAIVIETATILTFFYDNLSPWTIFAAILFVALNLQAFSTGRGFIENRMNFNFFRFSQRVSAYLARGVGLFLTVFFVGLYAAGGLSDAGFGFILNTNKVFISHFVPRFEVEMNVNDFYYTFSENQIRTKFSDNAQFQSLNETQQDEAIHASGRALRNQVAEITTVPVEGGDTVSSYFKKVTENYLPQMEDGAPAIALVVGMLILLYSVIIIPMSILRMLIFVPISWILYQILFGMGVIKSYREDVQKERIYFA